MLDLTPQQRKFLKAQAHSLKPVVMIGNAGLTEAVLKETARGLAAHELIKVRVQNDHRDEREAWLAAICERLDCAPVQHIGKLLLIYKPAEAPRLVLP
ncbi:MAG: ribosome assembly RNA-binding protein YhbY [Hydrogenophilales bacterium CG03_land_8_20_14_0_80_62_28]|nr:YhbY family RNA-binding protein [Betaproteobacteria bacterium]OIO79939.1 MAG: RNA-binding protein [Hydrogenophilaceae bacterium CG1_02_62_390]PIV23133.1 MAG: ribosome assembly RNA-binding protein YhbY [Hydrogenophilales bacterium CG03_land_8_20_14_0_80_62_28]PIW38663.1 MAG: ribosome assembly RNA-binding protein YhbY [Hydrogenophilales bacterium CG15_BIG_FIL_POST_REV_8_21_14_020_62_31]PIW72267.1 MAG: ribosome assembly RNA-binding protein YhbY [Hydrogenophilales bacterium CG12_big_fil_rev_8_21